MCFFSWTFKDYCYDRWYEEKEESYLIFNPYTKEAYDFEMIDLCRNLEIHPKVKEMYENFMFMLGML